MAQKTTFTTLGTAGGPVPKLHRAQPAHLIQRGDQNILVDCGDGAIEQLMRAGVDFRNLYDIVLSHHHIDHIGGLFACIGKNMMMMRQTPLRIYGPIGTKRILDGLCKSCDVTQEIGLGFPGKSYPHPSEFVEVHEIAPGDAFDIGDIRVSCCENTHYRSEEKFGQDGAISLSLRFDAPDRSIVFTGDTGPCRAVEELAKGAGLLVGELMDVEGTMAGVRANNPNMPADRIEMMAAHMSDHHLICTELGKLATVAGVEHLVAVHIPLNTITPETAPTYVAQIAQTYAGKITIAEDFDQF